MTTAPASERKTIDKAMQLMMAFSHERPELAVTELAERLGMHKSVVSRLASSLRSWGMLEQNPATRRLRVGPAAFRLGALFSHRNSLAEMAVPSLADLVQHTGQSVHLSVLDGLQLLVIATVMPMAMSSKYGPSCADGGSVAGGTARRCLKSMVRSPSCITCRLVRRTSGWPRPGARPGNSSA